MALYRVQHRAIEGRKGRKSQVTSGSDAFKSRTIVDSHSIGLRLGLHLLALCLVSN